MLVSTFITRVNYALRGTDDEPPSVGSDEWAYWLDTLNRKKNELYEDVTKLWSNTYEVRSFGTISASAAPEYDLDDDFLAPSDIAYVVTATGSRRPYDIVKPQTRHRGTQQVFITGMYPLVLHFTNEILSDSDLVGGELYVPGYYMPEDMTAENQDVLLPDPNWGVAAVAAELAANDIVYEDKEANLTAKANYLYNLMVKKNRRGTYDNPRTSPISVPRIGQRMRHR